MGVLDFLGAIFLVIIIFIVLIVVAIVVLYIVYKDEITKFFSEAQNYSESDVRREYEVMEKEVQEMDGKKKGRKGKGKGKAKGKADVEANRRKNVNKAAPKPAVKAQPKPAPTARQPTPPPPRPASAPPPRAPTPPPPPPSSGQSKAANKGDHNKTKTSRTPEIKAEPKHKASEPKAKALDKSDVKSEDTKKLVKQKENESKNKESKPSQDSRSSGAKVKADPSNQVLGTTFGEPAVGTDSAERIPKRVGTEEFVPGSGHLVSTIPKPVSKTE